MPSKIRLHCNRASKAAMVLVKGLRVEGLDALRIKRINSRYNYPEGHTVINWGSTSIPEDCQSTVLNSNEAVSNASNKTRTLELIGSPVPFTTDKEEAKQWLAEDSMVYCRTLTRASEGRGIVITDVGEELTAAPLYTKGILISRELRVHVFDGKVIHFAQKKKMNSERREEEGITLDPLIRNTKGGWIFALEGVEINDAIGEASIEAVSSLGLLFGAVDIIVEEGTNTPYVLEVNSAPGIAPDSTTLKRYVDAICSYTL